MTNLSIVCLALGAPLAMAGMHRLWLSVFRKGESSFHWLVDVSATVAIVYDPAVLLTLILDDFSFMAVALTYVVVMLVSAIFLNLLMPPVPPVNHLTRWNLFATFAIGVMFTLVLVLINPSPHTIGAGILGLITGLLILRYFILAPVHGGIQHAWRTRD